MTGAQIDARLDELAVQIAEKHRGLPRPLVVVPILKVCAPDPLKMGEDVGLGGGGGWFAINIFFGRATPPQGGGAPEHSSGKIQFYARTKTFGLFWDATPSDSDPLPLWFCGTRIPTWSRRFDT